MYLKKEMNAMANENNANSMSKNEYYVAFVLVVSKRAHV